MNLGGPDHVCLRQREIDLVSGVDAVQFNLRRAGVVEREGVAKLAWRNRSILVGSPFLQSPGKALILPQSFVRGSKEYRGQCEDHR